MRIKFWENVREGGECEAFLVVVLFAQPEQLDIEMAMLRAQINVLHSVF